MEKSHALKLLAYDYWANCRLFSAIDASSESIPTEIEDVLSHLLGAKSIWHKRIIQEEAPKDLFNRKDLRILRKINEQLKLDWDYLLEKYATTTTVSYNNLSGEKAQTSLTDILTHVVNHGSYHRGQLIRILRYAGITPLETDYIVFCRQ